MASAMCHSQTESSSHRSALTPNSEGTRALHNITTRTPGCQVDITETRVLDFETNTSALFSNDPRIVEAKWLGKDNQVVWLKELDFGVIEFWFADADNTEQTYVNLRMPSNPDPPLEKFSVPVSSHCAGRINGRATHLKVHRLRNQYFDDIAIAVACPAYLNGDLYNETSDTSPADGVRNAIWYTTLRKKAMTNNRSDPNYLKYIISPTRFVNALRGTDLECPLPSPDGTSTDFDISMGGIVFLARDSNQSATAPNVVNTYYIPLETFTETSELNPQIIKVKGLEGRSSHPVFSPTGDSVALLKKQHPTDVSDRNRVVVVNNIRDFHSRVADDNMPTRQSKNGWHLSPYSVTWSEDGKELYVIAVEDGIRKLYKLPATLSSIKAAPQPISGDNKMPADVRNLRMVYSAPMDTRSTRL